jgi:acetyl/propionyl-CoA carboxylase alpha subunit
VITRVLVANRGEIAVRVIRACRELGLDTVAVYSDADAGSRHTLAAHRAVRIGPAPSTESYLSASAILAAAAATGADAVHPGYGFLSENADFADACAAAGLTFIGPPGDVIRRLGSKIAARALATSVGVATVPGETPADQSTDAIVAAAMRVGLPVLIKPSAGGGGIGMKRVHDAAALPHAVDAARREALASFADGTLYVERLVERPRHVEVQVMADHHGQVVHLFERECSIQRRHQKIVEESPSVAVTPALRTRMGAAAVAITSAAGYRNAGTVEFLVDGTGDAAAFYFLEVNTRLQVEHGVTEQVTGVDLVQAQIAVAGGGRLPWRQEDLTQRGHAIELRVYAEDPTRDDLPAPGPLLLYREPSRPGVRVDSGVGEGDEVSVHYDPLIAKLVVTADTREAARRRALEALGEFPILGVQTNVALLGAILRHPRFVSGQLDTRLLETEGAVLRAESAPAQPSPNVLAIASAARRLPSARTAAASSAGQDPWDTLRGARG